MTIRRRLVFSSVAILLLFATNLAFYFWGNLKRNSAVDDLQRAAQGRIALLDVKGALIRLNLVMNLEQGIIQDPSMSKPLDPSALKEHREGLEAIRVQIDALREASGPDSIESGALRDFAATFDKFSRSLMEVYENVGVDYAKVVTIWATDVDPALPKLTNDLYKRLEEIELQRSAKARQNFENVETFTNRLAILTFGLSTVLAMLVAFFTSRYLTRGLKGLAAGAARFGSGELDHRIELAARDELGDLAGTFNEMAGNLSRAQEELHMTNVELAATNEAIEQQRQLSEKLLLNILPKQVAEELQERGEVSPRYFEDVTVLFTDFKGFTLSTEHLAADELVSELHDYFTAFDRIVERYGLEKMKTIGDSYMCVGGLPVRSPSHAVDAVLAGFEMLEEVKKRLDSDLPFPWHVRIGIHTGPVIAGVVGIQKFAFDIWGDTVNYASRMESSGEPGRVNISERTYSRVRDFIDCEHRGKVRTKDGKDVDMFFASGLQEKLLSEDSEIPPPAFRKRYSVYFQKEPPAVSSFLFEPPEAEPVTIHPSSKKLS